MDASEDFRARMRARGINMPSRKGSESFANDGVNQVRPIREIVRDLHLASTHMAVGRAFEKERMANAALEAMMRGVDTDDPRVIREMTLRRVLHRTATHVVAGPGGEALRYVAAVDTVARHEKTAAMFAEARARHEVMPRRVTDIARVKSAGKTKRAKREVDPNLRPAPPKRRSWEDFED